MAPPSSAPSAAPSAVPSAVPPGSDDAFDMLVLGAGPGGYVAALRAAQLGLRVAVVERAHLGGVCLNWGCIPTKALLRSAGLLRDLRHAGDHGLTLAAPPTVDLAAMVARSRAVARRLAGGIGHLLKKAKVTVIEGHGRLDGPGRLCVTPTAGGPVRRLVAPHIVLATGARPRSLPGLAPDGQVIWTAREAMTPTHRPNRLLVIGSGAIGMEFASFYQTLGSQVTVVEVMDRILPVEDAEISALAHKAFTAQGMTLLTGTTVRTLTVEGSGQTARGRAQITGEDGTAQEIIADRVILAVGIVGNVEDIGLETTRARVDRAHVVTDSVCRTDEPGLYAIGDLAGPPWLAHKASHEGSLVAELAAGLTPHPLDPERIPACTFCHPQIASLGLTEAAARKQGRSLRIGRFPFHANGKAIAQGEPEGLVKTLFDAETGELLGAHMIGAEVTEMIQGFAIARSLETTEADLMATVFPHPTLSEMMHESVLDAFGRALHV